MTRLTPSACMETHRSARSALSMVRRWWLITMSCVVLRSTSMASRRRSRLEVVEGGLDLVEHVEAAPCACGRRQRGARGPSSERYAAREQRHLGDPLAAGLGHDLDACGGGVVGHGHLEVTVAPGEQHGEDLLEDFVHGLEGVDKAAAHLAVDDLEGCFGEVGAGVLQVGHLLADVLGAALEGLELLEGDLVHRAERGQLALELLELALAGGAVFWRGPLRAPPRGRRPSGTRWLSRRRRHLRPSSEPFSTLTSLTPAMARLWATVASATSVRLSSMERRRAAEALSAAVALPSSRSSPLLGGVDQGLVAGAQGRQREPAWPRGGARRRVSTQGPSPAPRTPSRAAPAARRGFARAPARGRARAGTGRPRRGRRGPRAWSRRRPPGGP